MLVEFELLKSSMAVCVVVINHTVMKSQEKVAGKMFYYLGHLL